MTSISIEGRHTQSKVQIDFIPTNDMYKQKSSVQTSDILFINPNILHH